MHVQMAQIGHYGHTIKSVPLLIYL